LFGLSRQVTPFGRHLQPSLAVDGTERSLSFSQAFLCRQAALFWIEVHHNADNANGRLRIGGPLKLNGPESPAEAKAAQ